MRHEDTRVWAIKAEALSVHNRWYEELGELVIGKDCILRDCGGIYQGRRARIEATIVDSDGMLRFLAAPYRVMPGGLLSDEVLIDHRDARTYWPVERLAVIWE